MAVVAMMTTGAALNSARAQSLIRDAEIESIIRTYAAPLLQDAGIAPASVTFRMLNDHRINAFVTTGPTMMLFTGLLLRTETTDALVGVIAHEIGHIAGGHLVQLRGNVETLQTTQILSMLLGAAAGALAGRPDVGMAVGMGAQGAALRNFLSYTRTQESAADSFALRALDRQGLPADGMLSFMRDMERQTALNAESQDAYMQTHPLTRARIRTVEDHIARAAASSRQVPAAWQDLHARLMAKLRAFLRPPGETLRRYADQTDIPARYARAIAYYRGVDLMRALAEIDGLIAAEPNNPYFHELKGQMLFESGRAGEALASYERSVALAPAEPLLRIALAHALIESGGGAASLAAAEDHLRNALSRERDNAMGWRLLGQVYGRTDQPAMADYAMAETALRSGDPDRALFHVGRAESQVKHGSPTWLRLQDIRAEARRAQADAN
jgi:predicted Zn-dependent protease